MGEWFGDIRCRYGHETRLFNIGRGHFVACDVCRTFLFVGSNLMSNWRQESESVWRKNREASRVTGSWSRGACAIVKAMVVSGELSIAVLVGDCGRGSCSRV